MAYSLSAAWTDGYHGPFLRNDASLVTLMTRTVEDGFVVYKASDGNTYHASGRVVEATDDTLEIVALPASTPAKTRKKKSKKTARYNSRLTYIIRAQREATRTLARYVANKWPIGAAIKYELANGTWTSRVMQHDATAGVVVVYDDLAQKKLRVPYAKIIEKRIKMS